MPNIGFADGSQEGPEEVDRKEDDAGAGIGTEAAGGEPLREEAAPAPEPEAAEPGPRLRRTRSRKPNGF